MIPVLGMEVVQLVRVSDVLSVVFSDTSFGNGSVQLGWVSDVLSLVSRCEQKFL